MRSLDLEHHARARAERVNDFAPLFVMNLLRNAVVMLG